MFAVPGPAPLVPGCRPAPAVRFLSNGHYRVLITAAGSGVSSLDGLALTRWRGDAVEDADGFYVYLRDLDTGSTWSAGLQPTGVATQHYGATWQPGSFTIEQNVGDVSTRLEVCVPPDANVELRTLTLANDGSRRRRIELTTFVEVVLEEAAAFAAHPAFSKLFVQTEHAAAPGVLLARRRPRLAHKHFPWMVHALPGVSRYTYETDRALFFGRCARPGRPRALSTELSGSAGIVLDPILSLRTVVDLAPGERKQVTCLLGAAPTRAECLSYVERYASVDAIEEARREAGRHAERELQRCELTQDEAAYFQSLAGAVLYDSPALRRRHTDAAPEHAGHAEVSPRVDHADVNAFASRLRLSDQASHVVLRAESAAGMELEPPLLRAHAYWKALGVPIELVVVRGEITREDASALHSVASLVVEEALPDLADTLPDLAADALPDTPSGVLSDATIPAPAPDDETLAHFNGYGGFAAGGREYVVRLRRDAHGALQYPPRAWINVVANEEFGFLVSETGAGYTWSRNSRERRLTPWSNDPVLDPHSEAFYVRDETSGAFWSPFPGPAPAAADYETRHGFGYTTCAHASHGLAQRMRTFVPRDAPLKVTTLRVSNLGSDARALSFFAYYDLAPKPDHAAGSVVAQPGADSGAVLVRRRTGDDGDDGVTFASVIHASATAATRFTCDRTRFVGRNGSLTCPAALRGMSNLDDAAVSFDPASCIAQQVKLDLPPNGEIELAFLFGRAESVEHARRLIAEHGTHEAIERAWDGVQAFWRRGLSRVQVQTPVPALDVMINGWLPYQALSCRIWGRSALYQSGGAFGFRDQLQDATALAAVWPNITRKQILLHAAQQFSEGDVLHWWHPPEGRGIRTRCVDDLVWLPWSLLQYLRATGDWDILDERTPFIEARQLEPDEDEALLTPQRSHESADLYEHSCRALERALAARSPRGLPLFGSGDWNDGMNRVGREGRGESVWMAFFLHAVLGEFIPVCTRRDDLDRARRYAEQRRQLRIAVDAHAWDGAWYRRGTYDSGAPLGSKDSDECVIDALAQAWGVLSNAAPRERARRAIQSVEERLISEPDGLIRLLWPPFENTAEDPGYIKGYARGVRENGGQYTHAALWVIAALAALGRNDRVARLLEMISPVSYARTPERAARYGLEPYVVAADVYGAPPHVGRGGWSWYTGSAGWMYRVALESLLGFRLDFGKAINLNPCIPDDWPEFRVRYRFAQEDTGYDIVVRNPHRNAECVIEARVDGNPLTVDDRGARIPLAREAGLHVVEVVVGPREHAAQA